MITSPHSANVLDFGAIPDGATLNTKAIQSALDHVAAGGGGIVHIPAGRFVSGTLFVRSNVTLDLHPSATLVASTNWEDYPDLNDGDKHVHHHFIVLDRAERPSITGRGTIDGSAPAFCEPPFDTPGWIRAKPQRPDAMILVRNCQDVLIEGVRLYNPPNWCLDLYESDRIRVTGLQILNDGRWPNNDGIDISGSHDVIISDCQIETGDDAIVINGRTRSSKRITVTNCIIRTECVAMKIGWEYTLHNISQITFSNCVCVGCNRGVAAYTCNGAIIEDIAVSNIVFDSNSPVMFPRPIHFDLRRGRDNGRFGAIRNITISNFVARTQGRVLMTSEDGGHIENITIRDLHLIYPYVEDPFDIAEGNTSSQFSNKNREARKARAALVLQNIQGLYIDNLRTTWPTADSLVDKDWQITHKRENGGTRIFTPSYASPLPTDFALYWARNVSGFINAPYASGSTPEVPHDVVNCPALHLKGKLG